MCQTNLFKAILMIINTNSRRRERERETERRAWYTVPAKRITLR